MPKFQYQGTPLTPPPLTLSAGVGSTTAAKAGTYYVWLQYRNMAGFSAVSDVRSQAIAAGQSLEITIPAIARPLTNNGTFIWEFVVLANTTNNPSTAVVVATYPGYESDRTTEQPLPITLYLENDDALSLGGSVASLAELPAAPVNGMRRAVDSLGGQILAYSLEQTDWIPVFPSIFSTYVSSAIAPIGADLPAAEVEDTNVVSVSYAATGGASAPVGYWLVNDGTTAIAAGTGIRVSVAVGSQDASAEFTGLLKLIFLGYANTTTGVLDTASALGGGSMSGIGVEVPYQGGSSNFVLPKDLPPNTAFCFQIKAEFSQEYLNSGITQGSVLRISAKFRPDTASFNPLGDIFGSLILAKFGTRRIVPSGAGLDIKALKGSGSIEVGNGSYSFTGVSEQDIPGLLPNLDDQNCWISVNGGVFVSDINPDFAALRAIAGTVDGVGAALDWQNVALSPTLQLQVVVNHPSNIRVSYPDGAIAGSAAYNNATKVRIYFKTGAGNVFFIDQLVTPEEPLDTFVVGSTAGTDSGVNTLPVVPDDFGLFEPSSFTPSSVAGSSIFSAATYSVAIAYLFENTVTRIRHDAPGAIYEAGGTLADLFALRRAIAPSVTTATQLRAISDELRWQNQLIYLGDTDAPYRWKSESTQTDDGDNYIRPDDVLVGEPGRWIKDDPNRVLSVTGTPDPLLGQTGDLAIDLTDSTSNNFGDTWLKTGSGWEFKGRLGMGQTLVLPEAIGVTETANAITVFNNAGSLTAKDESGGDRLIAYQELPPASKAASFTLALSDRGNMIALDSATDLEVTVPPGTFPVGAFLPLLQVGSGLATFLAGAGVTLLSQNSPPQTGGQYTLSYLYQLSLNTWILCALGGASPSPPTEEEPVSFTGVMICTGECFPAEPDIGKAFKFDSTGTFTVNVSVAMDVISSVDDVADAIQVHVWSQEPNTAFTGRIWVASLPRSGGATPVVVTDTNRWITLQIKMGGVYDTVCFRHSGNALTVINW